MQDNIGFSDSDDSNDDLLGIREAPIIRQMYKPDTIESETQKSLSQRALNPHDLNNMKATKSCVRGRSDFNGIAKNINNDDGWIQYKRNKKTKSPRPHTSRRKSPSPKGTQLFSVNRLPAFNSPSNDNREEITINGQLASNSSELLFNAEINSKEFILACPTMEVIDIYKSKQNKYQRMREVHDVTGFVVNVHDATNFDIDLEIPTELHEKYRDVISNQYTYQDLGPDFLENPDLNCTTQITPRVGTTYRCRLRGVGINQLSSQTHTWKSNQMCVEIKQLIDRTDGWVTCILSDIDVYQRLLVDIVINTCQGPINIRDYLLARMDSEEIAIFYPYSGKRDRNRS